MTVTTTSNKVILLGNGATTVWPFTFQIPNAASLQLSIFDAAGNQTVIAAGNYTVTGLGAPAGGAVTYPLSGSPLAAGSLLMIYRVVPLTQPQDINNQSGFFPAVVMGALDNLEMQIQQVYETQTRAVLNHPSDPAVVQLAPVAARAGKAYAFDSVTGGFTTSQNTMANIDSIVSGALASSTGLNRILLTPNYASLLTMVPFAGAAVYMQGYSTYSDGGEGIFYWNAASAATPDGAIVVKPTGGATNGRWIRQGVSGVYNLLWFGASAVNPASSGVKTANKAILQTAIATLDAAGGGVIEIPWPIDYGYSAYIDSSQPNFTGTVSEMMVLDRGKGSTHSAEPPPAKDGWQERRFYSTVQTVPQGQHDGNGFLIRGKWHPYIWLENTNIYAAPGDPSRTAGDNLRASIIWGYQGLPKWQLGTGQTELGNVSADHMMHFVLSTYSFDGGQRLTPYLVNYLTGAVNYSTGSVLTNAAHWFKHEPLVTNAFPTVMFENSLGNTQIALRNSISSIVSATPVAGGAGYVVGNVLTVVGGTGTAGTLTVATVSAGAITSVTITTAGLYSAYPPAGCTVTGGAGNGATFNLSMSAPVDMTMTNNGGNTVFSGLVAPKFGSTAQRPTGTKPTGSMYFDTTLVVPIWWTGAVWVNGAGTTV